MGDDISVDVTVDGIELDSNSQEIIDLYEQNIETYIRKNQDYSNSFVRSGAVQCVYNGNVDDDALFEAIAEQMWVRMLDKQSRTQQLLFDGEDALVDDEAVEDTLLDWANYAVMLAAQTRLHAKGNYCQRHGVPESSPSEYPSTLPNIGDGTEKGLPEPLRDAEAYD